MERWGRDYNRPIRQEAKCCQEQPEFGKGKEGSSTRAFKGSMALLTAWFQTSGLQIRIESISVVISHSICGRFLPTAVGN